jgi:pimeloyl-ACP methyl ester carboxylesterase
MSGTWRKIRKIWATTGSVLLAVFVLWSWLGFRANATAKAAFRDDPRVRVVARDDAWQFVPVHAAKAPGRQLLLYPGGLVEPTAYAPLSHALAEHGYFVTLVALPRRGAFGGADDAVVFARARAAMTASASDAPWVVAGHSKGGAVAARMVRENPDGLVAAVLVGTSHPRDFSLADSPLSFTQILADRDPIASIERADRNRRNLPADTRRIVVHGGNHSQFGDYGFQPGDRFSRTPRDEQRDQVIAAFLDVLAAPTTEGQTP